MGAVPLNRSDLQDPSTSLPNGILLAPPNENVLVPVVPGNLLALLGRVVDRGDARVVEVLLGCRRDRLEEVGQGEEVSFSPKVKICIPKGEVRGVNIGYEGGGRDAKREGELVGIRV